MSANKLRFKLIAIVFGICLSLAVAELALRIFKPALVTADIEQIDRHDFAHKNELALDNLKGTAFYNVKLDSVIYRTSNNFGFRGPDLPADNDSLFKIVAVGGSTTLCHYLSDGFDWPSVVRKKLCSSDSLIWMNNAGLDGHSTFGHLRTLPKYILPLHPQMILFLINCNDVERKVPNPGYDPSAPPTNFSFVGKPPYIAFLYAKLKSYRMVVNWYYFTKRKKALSVSLRVWHQNIDFKKLWLTETNTGLKCQKTEMLRRDYIPAYRQRVLTIIKLCRDNKVVPVFITQPTVLGNVIDSVTGVNLGQANFDKDVNGDIYSSMLDVYNLELKNICRQTNSYYIDLAAAMPKNTVYYYDFIHYTNQGSAMVANIILDTLTGIVSTEKAAYYKPDTKKQK